MSRRMNDIWLLTDVHETCEQTRQGHVRSFEGYRSHHQRAAPFRADCRK